jgi:hypothetical protein
MTSWLFTQRRKPSSVVHWKVCVPVAAGLMKPLQRAEKLFTGTEASGEPAPQSKSMAASLRVSISVLKLEPE